MKGWKVEAFFLFFENICLYRDDKQLHCLPASGESIECSWNVTQPVRFSSDDSLVKSIVVINLSMSVSVTRKRKRRWGKRRNQICIASLFLVSVLYFSDIWRNPGQIVVFFTQTYQPFPELFSPFLPAFVTKQSKVLFIWHHSDRRSSTVLHRDAEMNQKKTLKH